MGTAFALVGGVWVVVAACAPRSAPEPAVAQRTGPEDAAPCRTHESRAAAEPFPEHWRALARCAAEHDDFSLCTEAAYEYVKRASNRSDADEVRQLGGNCAAQMSSDGGPGCERLVLVARAYPRMAGAWRALAECAAKQGLVELCSEAGSRYLVLSRAPSDDDPIHELVTECRGRAANDTDLDGLTDDRDQCPWAMETVNGYRDRDGCPEYVEFTAPEGVGLRAESVRLLDRIAQRGSGGAKTRLVVYVDGNAELARRRALAIREFLAARGWDPESIDAVGSDTGLPGSGRDELLRLGNLVLTKR